LPAKKKEIDSKITTELLDHQSDSETYPEEDVQSDSEIDPDSQANPK
jgi:hypothetical protein